MKFPASEEPQWHHYKLPAKAFFEYHCFESEKSADAEIWRRTHQKVTVLRILTPAESDYEMYRVRFDDGHEATVFADELMNSRGKFERPGYRKEPHAQAA